MTNTSHSEFMHLLRSVTASFLVAGVVLGGSGAVASVASVVTEATGRGSDLMIPSIANGKITMVYAIPRQTLRPAAPAAVKQVDADLHIALGMLLLLTGCTLHCMWLTCNAHHAKRHRRAAH